MHYDYRNDFPLLMQNKIIYIDNAATSQRPQCVIDAEGDFYKNYNANPLRGLYSLSVEATEVYENAREAVRKFIGAEKSNEIIFTRNTTESLNLGKWWLKPAVPSLNSSNVLRMAASTLKR